ncbi:hypothetical protein [Novipirellula artificiosorum]|uniref:Methyltransferase domain protein n=1 Tax=Novipirellula artificiosorum TaxID=2528016 RepID=A0A5C6CGX4_9BACT|nr:hypothetical protein [Novipirellula artificiosorum]TWU21989.1 hypothetical protein Poly41_71280 [Novipirellula artificiosorum]
MLSPSNQPNAEDGLLREVELAGTGRELTSLARQFLDAGRDRFDTVNVFDFVPSNYEMLWSKLDALPRGRFCEWGSGFGLATGLANLLGFDAIGIELSPELADASRKLLNRFDLEARIECDDYLQRIIKADVYFVYSWPSQIAAVERLYCESASPHAKLLICYGQDDIRCKMLRDG